MMLLLKRNAITWWLIPLFNVPICVLIVWMFYSAWNLTMKPQTNNILLCIEGISVFVTVGSVDHRTLECLLIGKQTPGLHSIWFPGPESKLTGGALEHQFPQARQAIRSTLMLKTTRMGVKNKPCFVGLKLSWEYNVTFSLSMTLANVHWFFYT